MEAATELPGIESCRVWESTAEEAVFELSPQIRAQTGMSRGGEGV